MSVPSYPSYTTSEVKWFREIPSHWRIDAFKWHIARNDGGVWGEEASGNNEVVVLRSTDQTVDGHWSLEEPARRKLTTSEFESALLREGDLLVTKSSGSALHIGKTTLVTREIEQRRCCFSNFMQRIRLTEGFVPKYAWYFLNNNLARIQFDYFSHTTTGLANLNGTIIGDLAIPVPQTSEQAAIAAFLDRETAKIDALVAEQEKLIALLKGKRQAVISHAVTKGLNPDAPMKPSGIQWLGDVPAHWEVGPLKWFWSVTDCKHITAEFVNEGIPVVSIREVQSRFVMLAGAKRTTESFYGELIEGGREPRPGDLILSRNATVGEVAQVPLEHERFAMGQDVCLLRRLEPSLSPDYMQHVMQSPVVVEQLSALMVGSTFKRVNVEQIRALVVPCPPPTEQADISAYLSAQTTALDTLVAEASEAVALLKERRSALISAAVTGQIDVRAVDEQQREAA